MNFFRSEEHVQRWVDLQGYEPGATITSRQMCDLAHAWWGNRLDPAWVPRPLAGSQAILDRLGLTEPYWRLF
jgi:hypothetical protein